MKNEKNFKVLVVEDDKLNAEIMSKFIKSNAKVENLTVETFHEVDHILDELKKSYAKPNMVILSEPTPGKVKFASEIRSRINQIKYLSPATEIIIISTPSKVEMIIDAYRSGAYDFVVKDEQANRNIVSAIHRLFNIKNGKGDFYNKRALLTSN